MRLEDVIYAKVRRLPEPMQREVLSFVDFVSQRDRVEDDAWAEVSAAGASEEGEGERWPEYGDADLKHHWL